jgi:hypothetical protein
MPCYNTPSALLRDALDSIRAQSYQRWELCIADDGSTSAATLEVLAHYESIDERILLCRLPDNQGIAAASNAALALAQGSYVIPMDHDDLLPDNALVVLVDYINSNPGVRFAYSDSDRIDSHGRRCRPFFKADWNYDLFLAQNYLNHLTAIESNLLRLVGGWREGYEGSQDYDLYLRLIEHLNAGEILHIPHVLYHWREVAGSFSQTRLGAAVQAARRAISDHLDRTGREASVSAPPGALIYNHIRWKLPQPLPGPLLVLLGETSVAMRELLDKGFSSESLRDLQILSIGSGSTRAGFSSVVDEGLAQAADTDVVLLINASATALPESVLLEMLACSMRDETVCVGLKCLDSESKIFAIPEQLAHRPDDHRLYAERWQGATAGSRGYFAHLLLQQSTDILRPDAVAFRRSHLAAYGRLDSRYSSLHLALADFCLLTAQRGFQNTWVGAASLQFENSRALKEEYNSAELSQFRERWSSHIGSARFVDREIAWSTVTEA